MEEEEGQCKQEGEHHVNVFCVLVLFTAEEEGSVVVHKCLLGQVFPEKSCLGPRVLYWKI